MRRKNQIDYDEVEKAITYAIVKHLFHTRRNGNPYITHPIIVAMEAYNMGVIQKHWNLDCTTLVVAAILHDVIEDCDVEEKEIAEKFGKEVGRIVKILSRVYESYEDYIGKVCASGNKYAIVIKLCDVRHNNSDEEVERYTEAESKLIAAL